MVPKKYRIALIAGVTLGAVSLLLVGTWLLVLSPPPKTVVVTKTEGGFVPKEVVLNVGDTVTFVNKGAWEMWPASDSHPAHGLYPTFDAKRPIPVGASWSFVFDKPGEWTFHDHLDSIARGSVRVNGAWGSGELGTCLETETDPVSRANCWGRDLLRVAENKGWEAAFDEFVSFSKQDPSFLASCHDVMHVLGKKAYNDFLKDESLIVARPETTYCAYGFFHGFIEEMFSLQGMSYVEDVRRYCEQLERSSGFGSAGAAKRAADACYHGIGHALFDSIPGSMWGDDMRMVEYTLPQCERVSQDVWLQALCASGIYNSLSNAYLAKSYNLVFNQEDPLRICRTQKEDRKDFCYKELVIGYLWEQRTSYDDSIAFIRRNVTEHQAEVLFAYFDDYIRHKMEDPSPARVFGLCDAFSSFEERTACVRGAIFAYTAGGEPGNEHARMLALCALFNETDATRAYCFKEAGTNLRVLHTQQEAEGVCASLSPHDMGACLGR